MSTLFYGFTINIDKVNFAASTQIEVAKLPQSFEKQKIDRKLMFFGFFFVSPKIEVTKDRSCYATSFSLTSVCVWTKKYYINLKTSVDEEFS